MYYTPLRQAHNQLHWAAPGITSINGPTTKPRSPFGDTIISRNEVMLFCAAAFLLAVASPFTAPVTPQMMPENLPVSHDSTEPAAPFNMEAEVEVEAQYNTPELNPQNTTVLFEHIDPELLVKVTASEPTS